MIEVTPKGETVWKQEGLGGILVGGQRLPNGNTLAADQNGRLLEITPKGGVTVVLEQPGMGFSRVSRY